MNPLTQRLALEQILILDGAMATELERMGCDLNHPLWSARLLLDDPGKVQQVHVSYLEAGADCITTCGYQASIPGLRKMGLSEARARELYSDSIRIAVEARAAAGSSSLIAASIGPYGACLADGSEYRGNYGVSERELELFHSSRIEIVADSICSGTESADLIAFETIPSLTEAVLLARVLEAFGGVYAWISFSCRDDSSTCEGQSIEECARALDAFPHIVAIGVNCTPPQYMTPLIRKMSAATAKPLIAYPNSGEAFDPVYKHWTGPSSVPSPGRSAEEWFNAGASILGGCCRTTPDDTARLVKWRSERA